MLNLINKFAVFFAIGVIGYLMYGALSGSASSLAEKKEKVASEITKKMLYPVFIKPQANASGINRDPFETGNDSYDNSQYADYLSSSDEQTKSSGELRGILMEEDGRNMAYIGNQVYGVGSKIILPDSEQLWQIDSIDKESVVLGCNGQMKILRILNKPADFNNLGLNPQDERQEKEREQ